MQPHIDNKEAKDIVLAPLNPDIFDLLKPAHRLAAGRICLLSGGYFL